MNKNAVLVGRGGFEPRTRLLKAFIYKAFSDYNPPTTQENRADFIRLYCFLLYAKKVIRFSQVDNFLYGNPEKIIKENNIMPQGICATARCTNSFVGIFRRKFRHIFEVYNFFYFSLRTIIIIIANSLNVSSGKLLTISSK